MPGSHEHDGSENGMAYRAFAQSSEAIAALRSHERLDDLKFQNIDKTIMAMQKDIENKIDEVKEMIETTNSTMANGFKSYDQKFWSLAIALIFILLGICAFLITYTLFPGKH